MLYRLVTGTILGAALLVAYPVLAENSKTEGGIGRIEKEVRRELVTLPYYSVFDLFTFRVDGENVTLMGKVSQPTLKSAAENVVKKIEGVERVDNRIEVLPLSPNDDRLRLALYRSIYGHTALQSLALRAVPPIHIIVENGHATLEGMVADEMQRNIAGTQANLVSGLFSVTNNLITEKKN
jgi:hyperosmotically inducible protein